jgi:hypothetical protein
MVRKCKVCKGIMYNPYSDTCQTCRETAGQFERAKKPKSKYVFSWDEYNMLLKAKVKQGLTYEEAKRELAFENRTSNKKQEEHNQKLAEEEKTKKPKDKFKEEFKKLMSSK